MILYTSCHVGLLTSQLDFLQCNVNNIRNMVVNGKHYKPSYNMIIMLLAVISSIVMYIMRRLIKT